MKYGFVIDNRKCIGCHACTTACKSEHEVPIGVNRTWVKQVEKGTFPDTRRLFSVMRCNHCTDAPCVTICPTEALFSRKDGIVDFDKDRCIGCKSCMQACPYDALYIDPETHTAAKCNYCAHRIDVGLEPACVNVCPEQAIISGDMENPQTEISQLLARQAVKVRKPEKGTVPNLFYIDADDSSLIPTATHKSNGSLWGAQATGVGHFAKEAEKMAFSNTDLIGELVKINGGYERQDQQIKTPKTVEVLMNKGTEVYNTPDKGILWGWEVSAYVWTKAISAGAAMVLFFGWITGLINMSSILVDVAIFTSLIFLMATGILLIKDLDQPKRFAYVLLRPHWSSWLVKGGYAITLFGASLTALWVFKYFNAVILFDVTMYIMLITSIVVAVYTAFLFAQARGRDFWQSPTLAIHMTVHAVMAGAALFLIINAFIFVDIRLINILYKILFISLAINLTTMLIELSNTHPTNDAAITIRSILRGRYKWLFWGGTIVLGNIIPMVVLIFMGLSFYGLLSASLLVLAGIYITEHVWVEAPQRIPLS